jgi:hypothetical protein
MSLAGDISSLASIMYVQESTLSFTFLDTGAQVMVVPGNAQRWALEIWLAYSTAPQSCQGWLGTNPGKVSNQNGMFFQSQGMLLSLDVRKHGVRPTLAHYAFCGSNGGTFHFYIIETLAISKEAIP